MNNIWGAALTDMYVITKYIQQRNTLFTMGY